MESSADRQKVNEMIRNAWDMGASDLYIATGEKAWVRCGKKAIPILEECFEEADLKIMLELFLDEEQQEKLKDSGETEFSGEAEEICRFRGSAYCFEGKYAVTLRLLSLQIPVAETLAVPSGVMELAEKEQGILFVAGNASSGRTTTAAALTDWVAEKGSKMIVVLDRCMEYRFDQADSMICTREIGRDSRSYGTAIRLAVRQNVDMLFVDEIDGGETFEAVLEAAEAGIFVIAVTGGRDAQSVLEHLLQLTPQSRERIQQRLSSVLSGVCVQRLFPRADGSGSVAAFEFLKNTEGAKNALREGKIYQIPSIIKKSEKSGMQALDDAVFELYMKSEITSEAMEGREI